MRFLLEKRKGSMLGYDLQLCCRENSLGIAEIFWIWVQWQMKNFLCKHHGKLTLYYIIQISTKLIIYIKKIIE